MNNYSIVTRTGNVFCYRKSLGAIFARFRNTEKLVENWPNDTTIRNGDKILAKVENGILKIA